MFRFNCPAAASVLACGPHLGNGLAGYHYTKQVVITDNMFSQSVRAT